MSIAKGAAAPTYPLFHRVWVRIANVTNRRCPATIFAHNRIAKEKGLTTNVDTSSIGVTIRYKALGTPGGNKEFFKYPPNP